MSISTNSCGACSRPVSPAGPPQVRSERCSNMLGRPKNRRKPSEHRVRLPTIHWRRVGVTLGALAASAAAAGAGSRAFDQPIETVAVEGRFQRVARVDVERVVKEKVHGAGLLSVDLAAVRRAIHTLPWVDSVSVQRAWPRGLNVLVIEQTAAARWGERGLLNTRGELFDTDERHIPPELAQLAGPDGKESLVAQRYLAAEGRLSQAGLRLTAMRLDARGAWEFDLANGVTVRLGRRQVDERFEKFMNTALKLVTQRGEDIAYVDMRYTNGFAIGWRGNAGHASASGVHKALARGAKSHRRPRYRHLQSGGAGRGGRRRRLDRALGPGLAALAGTEEGRRGQHRVHGSVHPARGGGSGAHGGLRDPLGVRRHRRQPRAQPQLARRGRGARQGGHPGGRRSRDR